MKDLTDFCVMRQNVGLKQLLKILFPKSYKVVGIDDRFNNSAVLYRRKVNELIEAILKEYKYGQK